MNKKIEQKADEIKELSKDLKNVLNQNDKLLKNEENDLFNILTILGLSMIVILVMIRLFKPHNKKKKQFKKNSEFLAENIKDSKDSYVIRLIKEQITLFLIAVAKRKINEFLERLEVIDEKRHL